MTQKEVEERQKELEDKEDIEDFEKFIEYYYSRRPCFDMVSDDDIYLFERILKLAKLYINERY